MFVLGRSQKFILAAVVAFVVSTTLLVFTSYAQNYTGRGVDMRNLSSHSCKQPALSLQSRLMQLKQEMIQIIECNRNGGLFQSGGCVDGAAVVTGHNFLDPAPDSPPGFNPEDRAGLSFNSGAYGLIGGADGASIDCVLASSDCSYDGNTIADGDTMELYEVAPTCGDPCSLVGPYTCNSGTFSPSPPAPSSDIYMDAALCPEGPCDECTHPFTDAPMVDGEQVAVFDPVLECAEICTSENIECDNGSLTSPSWGSNYQEACPSEPENCDDCPHPVTGESLPENTTITLYATDTSCGTCSSAPFTCTAGSFGDTTSFNYDDEADCTDANVCPPGCMVYVGGVYQETINDGESTTYYQPSTTLATCDTCADVNTQTCSGGADILFSSSYSTSISSLSACEAANPCPNTCAGGSKTWNVGGNSCTASVSTTSAGVPATADDSTGPYTGSATYACQNDGTWATTPTNVSCATNTCAGGSKTWNVGGNSCTASVSTTSAGVPATADDSTGPTEGRATYACQNDGTWATTPTSVSCATNTCAGGSKTWIVGGNSCTASVSTTSAGVPATADDSTGPTEGRATYACNNDGTWGAPTNTSCLSTGPWTTGAWSACTAPCGGGSQTRTVTCDYDNCTGDSATQQSCNTSPCSSGCYVDTRLADNASNGSCGTLPACTNTNNISWSAGDYSASDPAGASMWRFSNPSLVDVAWTGDCVSSSASCGRSNVSNGSYSATVTVRNSSTGEIIHQRTITAAKNTTNCSSSPPDPN